MVFCRKVHLDFGRWKKPPVGCLLVSGQRGGTLSWNAGLCSTLATLHPVAHEAGHTDAEQQQDIGTRLWDAVALVVLRALFVTVGAWLTVVLRATA